MGIAIASGAIAAGVGHDLPHAPWWLVAVTSHLCLSTIVGASILTAMEGLGRSLDEARQRTDDLDVVSGVRDREVSRAEALQRQLALAQKMEVVGQMAGGVAHDFNNILTVIQLEAMLASGTLDEVAPAREHLAAIVGATGRASALSQKLLAFSRNRSTSRTSVPLDDQIRSTEDLLRRLVGERVVVALALRAGDARVSVEPGQIEQVLTNLAANARDAMPAGGTLQIASARADFEGRPGVRVTVRDQGVGMDAETLARVCEPFYTTKASGTGLGLAMVYAIADGLGGWLRVDSVPGQGATIAMWLPCDLDPPTPDPPPDPAPPDPTPPPDLLSHARIVVVDDQPEVRSTVAHGLQRLGCMVWTAPSANDALALIGDLPVPPELLLTDAIMPGITGVALCERVAGRFPAVALVVMTGQVLEADAAATLDALGAVVLTKPFTPDALRDVVGAALSRSRA